MKIGGVVVTEESIRSVEPRLSVRHYYSLVSRERGYPKSVIRSILGKDPNRVHRAANRQFFKAKLGKNPVLRPKGVWDKDLDYVARLSSQFDRLLSDHGLSVEDIARTDDPILASYAKARAHGLTQRLAAKAAGVASCGLDDDLINRLQRLKFGDFEKSKPVKRWTRGAIKCYSRLHIGHGGSIVNKSGVPKKHALAESNETFGGGRAVSVCRSMAILSYRVLRCFLKAVIDRELLEFSATPAAEYERVLKSITLADWRLTQDGRQVRCYWRLAGHQVTWSKTQRSEFSEGVLNSSIDIPSVRL